MSAPVFREIVPETFSGGGRDVGGNRRFDVFFGEDLQMKRRAFARLEGIDRVCVNSGVCETGFDFVIARHLRAEFDFVAADRHDFLAVAHQFHLIEIGFEFVVERR